MPQYAAVSGFKCALCRMGWYNTARCQSSDALTSMRICAGYEHKACLCGRNIQVMIDGFRFKA